MLIAFDLAITAADERGGQREMVMCIAVAHIAAVQQDRVIQHRAVAIGKRGELCRELRNEFGVVGLNLYQLFNFGLVVLVM